MSRRIKTVRFFSDGLFNRCYLSPNDNVMNPKIIVEENHVCRMPCFNLTDGAFHANRLRRRERAHLQNFGKRDLQHVAGSEDGIVHHQGATGKRSIGQPHRAVADGDSSSNAFQRRALRQTARRSGIGDKADALRTF